MKCKWEENGLCAVFKKLLQHVHGEKSQNMFVKIIGFRIRIKPRTFHIQKGNANLSAMGIVSLSGVWTEDNCIISLTTEYSRESKEHLYYFHTWMFFFLTHSKKYIFETFFPLFSSWDAAPISSILYRLFSQFSLKNWISACTK